MPGHPKQLCWGLGCTLGHDGGGIWRNKVEVVDRSKTLVNKILGRFGEGNTDTESVSEY